MTARGFSERVRGIVRERCCDYNGVAVCEVWAVCQGRRAVAQLHHRRPRAMGSTRRPESNEAANALGCCAEDHAYIEANREVALKFGWLCLQSETPCEKPVLRRGKWVLLDDYGNVSASQPPAKEAS